MTLNKKSKKAATPQSRKSVRTPKKESLNVRGYYYLLLFLFLLIIDRVTKIWATNLKAPIDYGIFAFQYVTNTGAGFSIFTNQNTLLIYLSLIILGGLIFYYKQLSRLGVWLMITGLVSNLFDRIIFGHVIDFIDFKFWPVFNGADILICLGALLLIIQLYKDERKEKKMSKEKETIKEKRKRKK